MPYGTVHPVYRLERVRSGQVGELDNIFDGTLEVIALSKAYDLVLDQLAANPSNINSLLMDIVEEAASSPNTDLHTLVRLRSDWCPRCNGLGTIPCYMHVMNGMCFACLGDGQNRFKDMNIEGARKEFEERQESYKGLYLVGVTDRPRKPVKEQRLIIPTEERRRPSQSSEEDGTPRPRGMSIRRR